MNRPPNDDHDAVLMRRATDVVVRIAVVGLLVVWCFKIFSPFLIPLVWGIILAVALRPVYAAIESAVGGRRKLAATLLVVLCLGVLAVPVVALSGSLVEGVRFVSDTVESSVEGELRIPPAPPSVAGWPLIGPVLFETWSAASTSLETALKPFQPQLRAFGGWLVGVAKQAAMGGLLTAVAIVLAAFLLIRRETIAGTALAIGERVGGEPGAEAVRSAGQAIAAVAKGVVGVAAIQAALAAVGLALAGVPGAGLWALLVLMLAVAQMPAILVLGPAVLYLVAADAGTLTIVLFAVWSVVVSLSDAVLKPLLLGRGADLPVAVILIGAIGGLLLHGLIGLFVGAVVFSTGYRLAGAWLRRPAIATANG
jgi:predicted PurR-regulated permease PerM